MIDPNRRRSTSAINGHVAERIRQRRIMLGLTQQQLAEMVGITYQQVHKYECKINRISAGRLYEIACVLNSPIAYFYEAFGEEAPQVRHRRVLLKVVQNFSEIQNGKHQRAISQLARALAATDRPSVLKTP